MRLRLRHSINFITSNKSNIWCCAYYTRYYCTINDMPLVKYKQRTFSFVFKMAWISVLNMLFIFLHVIRWSSLPPFFLSPFLHLTRISLILPLLFYLSFTHCFLVSSHTKSLISVRTWYSRGDSFTIITSVRLLEISFNHWTPKSKWIYNRFQWNKNDTLS